MRISFVTLVIAVSVAALTILSFSQSAQAVDPRAEVPGATITGVILDANGHNVPNATVKLFLDGQLFDIPGNPQQSNIIADPYISIGRYQFNRLPYGQYTVTAEKPDAAGNIHAASVSVVLNTNTTTADIVIPDLVVVAPGTPSPSQSPSPTKASPAPGSPALILPALGMCLLIISRRNSN